MKTNKEIQKRFENLFNERSDLGIKMDLASKLKNQVLYEMCSDKMYKISVQIRELAWVLEGEVK